MFKVKKNNKIISSMVIQNQTLPFLQLVWHLDAEDKGIIIIVLRMFGQKVRDGTRLSTGAI